MRLMPSRLALVVGVLLAGIQLSAQSALVVPVGNSLVVNDTDREIAWIQDADLFKTMAASDPDLVNKISALSPRFSEPGFGAYQAFMGPGHFDTTLEAFGEMKQGDKIRN